MKLKFKRLLNGLTKYPGLTTGQVWVGWGGATPTPFSSQLYKSLSHPRPIPGAGRVNGIPSQYQMCFRVGKGRVRRDHQQHLPIPEQLQNLDGLRRHIGVLDVGIVAAVVSNHVARVQDRQCEDGASGHEAHEAHEPNVSIVVHECNLAPFVSQNEGDEPANDAPHIEDALEQRYV